MAVASVPSVATYKTLIDSCVQKLGDGREEGDIEFVVHESECDGLIDQIRQTRSDVPSEALQIHNPAVETVCRDLVWDIVASVDISEPAFAQVWVLLDVINILSDHELCEPGLGFWLVEELLDSQTIEGCRKVFDYLESRREKMTAKHFKQKSLVMLRCCNELLRRLSRAEDTVFCGRVFIFLFQSFPLGDKSSVNLRGEFHVENVTDFDPTPVKSEDAIKPMELDEATPQPTTSGSHTPAPDPERQSRSTPVPKTVKSEPKEQQPPPDLDALYPKFWALQSFFSSPTRLFDPANMTAFKDGIAQTLSCFKSVSNSSSNSTAATPADPRRGLKRKRSELDVSASTSTFNPKYLTNRDLFDLEIHDIAFRRHILVQALIMIDFLLSLSSSSKAKFEGLTNKSVLYPYTLSEEDTKWAQSTRAQVALYLQQGGNGNEGKFYYRMVDTVLSRDKNWVRWKAENCPPITREGVSPQMYLESRDNLAKQVEAARAPIVNPPGAGDLAFLSKIQPLEALKHPSKRHKVPTPEEYYRAIETDTLDLDFATTEEEKREIEERKAGRVWRALRSSKNRFVMCEKVQYGSDYKPLVEDVMAGEHEEHAAHVKGEEEAHENGENGADVQAEVDSAVADAQLAEAAVSTEHQTQANAAESPLEAKLKAPPESEDAEMQDVPATASGLGNGPTPTATELEDQADAPANSGSGNEDGEAHESDEAE
jgi:THO complex subunit 1